MLCPTLARRRGVGYGLRSRESRSFGSAGGGLGYSEERLRALWDKPPFSLRVLRQMNKTDGPGPGFGEDFLWALLATKAEADH